MSVIKRQGLWFRTVGLSCLWLETQAESSAASLRARLSVAAVIDRPIFPYVPGKPLSVPAGMKGPVRTWQALLGVRPSSQIVRQQARCSDSALTAWHSVEPEGKGQPARGSVTQCESLYAAVPQNAPRLICRSVKWPAASVFCLKVCVKVEAAVTRR